MVIHMMQPHNRECSAIGIPKKMAQMIFSKKLPSPPPYVTSFPNGKSARPANLKHCMPTGIPTMVMHQIHPAIKYPSALTRPPQSIHIIFPYRHFFLLDGQVRKQVIPLAMICQFHSRFLLHSRYFLLCCFLPCRSHLLTHFF